MSLTLTLHTQPEVPLEAEAIIPERFEGMSAARIAATRLLYGNRGAALGDFFRVEGQADGELRVAGDCALIKRIGSAMSRGRLVIDGNVGMHLGAAMSGGEILVEGDAGDWVGVEMLGGRIVVKGNAGHLVGSAIRGGRVGVRGGEIIVHGSAGNEIGSSMRRGLIAVGGDAGDFTGVNMLAGTVVVLGRLGWRTGAGMKRGSIISTNPAEMLPTFSFACAYRPVALRLVLTHLRGLGLPVSDEQIAGRYRRWSGDAVEMNRGEVLLPDR
ncbi:MAG: formylmethanofuran dehydrogenase subunit C [Sterolibacteriaceae bacterium]|nr:formylmethanofuran dehydrogenase subunit C [Sterolibacteriaceae bacterium]MBK9083840.1 formylmethanofuran dehydrogenase subunit C [Sterolibacteriaceae bacterium]